MENLNDRLRKIESMIEFYFYENSSIYSSNDVSNWVLDIEVSPVSENEVLTYSVALMNVDSNDDICYKFSTVKQALAQLFSLKSNLVNIYIHNLYYDFKPFLIEFCNSYGAKQNFEIIEDKKMYNPIKHKQEIVKILKTNKNDRNKDNYTYDLTFKKGQLYQAKFYGETREKGKYVTKQCLCFKDTLKVFPYSLKKASKDFINLDLSKEGLDYEKKRSLNDKLTQEEKQYIYEDVFALKHIVKKLIVEGFYINGRFVKFNKLTNSSQSLYDYKQTLLEDYENLKNIFSDSEYVNEIDTLLMNTNFFDSKTNDDVKADLLFKKVFPPLNYFEDSWLRKSYYGGLSMVDFNNVRKYEKYKNKIGQVFDVNSLYPFIMLERLLPIGRGIFKEIPYCKMSKDYKKKYPLYAQEIFIHDMKLKEGKTKFVQVKDRTDFNGRECIEENINLKGEKVTIRLVLCNPLIELLFENYDVKCFEFGSHIGYRGKMDIFKNYLEFWGEVKKNSEGCERAISKLRQNGLYGKYGTNAEGEIIEIFSEGNKWTTQTTYENYVGENIYLPIATFITSYAKQYLVTNINKNRDKFLYCDTDSIHVFGELKDIKGLNIDSKKYGAWKHEMTFTDFKYLGAKRYAEFNEKTQEWEIKCCGLTSEIMKSIKDINAFDLCEYTTKELKNVKLYTLPTDNYYYKDKDCTQKVKGLFKSKKAKIVKFGTLIVAQPYMITENPFSY